jgi:hypothetical protein
MFEVPVIVQFGLSQSSDASEDQSRMRPFEVMARADYVTDEQRDMDRTAKSLDFCYVPLPEPENGGEVIQLAPQFLPSGSSVALHHPEVKEIIHAFFALREFDSQLTDGDDSFTRDPAVHMRELLNLQVN